MHWSWLIGCFCVCCMFVCFLYTNILLLMVPFFTGQHLWNYKEPWILWCSWWWWCDHWAFKTNGQFVCDKYGTWRDHDRSTSIFRYPLPFSLRKNSGIRYKWNILWTSNPQIKKLLIVKQILLVSTSWDVERTVWRRCTLMLGCEGLATPRCLLFPYTREAARKKGRKKEIKFNWQSTK